MYYLCNVKWSKSETGSKFKHEKKFFSKKVSKYQPIFFLCLELPDRQTDNFSKESEKCQESIRKVSACIILLQLEIPGGASGTDVLTLTG